MLAERTRKGAAFKRNHSKYDFFFVWIRFLVQERGSKTETFTKKKFEAGNNFLKLWEFKTKNLSEWNGFLFKIQISDVTRVRLMNISDHHQPDISQKVRKVLLHWTSSADENLHSFANILCLFLLKSVRVMRPAKLNCVRPTDSVEMNRPMTTFSKFNLLNWWRWKFSANLNSTGWIRGFSVPSLARIFYHNLHRRLLVWDSQGGSISIRRPSWCH